MSKSSWQPYELDHIAQTIVWNARKNDLKTRAQPTAKISESLSHVFKMRANCAYGLERFWGDQLRLKAKAEDAYKAELVAATWSAFAQLMGRAKVPIPNVEVDATKENEIERMADALWNLGTEQTQASLAVLTSLCDALIWWSQRLKLPKQTETSNGPS
jgi:hypothetical protein